MNRSIEIRQLNKKIAKYLYQYFVTNTYAMAVQMDDGNYVTKYLPVSECLIEEMLNQKGSLGCYQQCYKSNMVKWICFDFDCLEKNNPDLNFLFKNNVKPLLKILDEYKINYLTEFSGRRGIHVWVIFSHLIEKEKAYKILSFFKNELLAQIKEFQNANLDSFPATNSAKGNIVGKQVKLPLSYHRNGNQSWFFEGEFTRKNLETEYSFLTQQLNILSSYTFNDYQTICNSIGIDDELVVRLKYKKYKVCNEFSLSIWKAIETLSELKVYSNIFQRMTQGHALRNDWLVLLGTFSPWKDGEKFIIELFSIFPNYDKEITIKNVKKYRQRYYPATLEYLYYMYGIEMEKEIEKDETGFSFLLKKFGVVPKVISTTSNIRKKIQINIFDTVQKEIKYFLDNDEVLNITVWNDLNNIKSFDLYRLDKIIENLLTKDTYSFNWEPLCYVYQREEKNKTRFLVSQSAFDRILTTQIALILQEKLKSFWNSYSYNVSFGSKTDIFYNWYSSWGEYINQIKTFIEVPFMQNYEVFTIDLKGFYDHVDFLSVYSIFENELNNSEKNLFKFLIDYNDKLMRTLFESERVGVPQGPAYARIIAEMYLDKVLSKILVKFEKSTYHLYRYVDDIVVFSEPEFDSKEIFDYLCNELMTYGLPINVEKSQWYGSIKSCNEENKRKILHKDKFTYDLQNTTYKEYLTLVERNKDIYNYLSKNKFDINSLGLFFNNKVYLEASERFFLKYAIEIMESKMGRGNSFRRFYEYVFTNLYPSHFVMDNKCLDLIPLNGVNFANFLGIIYFLVQRKEIDDDIFARIQTEYLSRIETNRLNEEYRILVDALLKIRYKVDE